MLLLLTRLVVHGVRFELMSNKYEKKLLLHLSVLYQSWNAGAEDLEFVLHPEMRPVHPHFPKKGKQAEIKQINYKLLHYMIFHF